MKYSPCIQTDNLLVSVLVILSWLLKLCKNTSTWNYLWFSSKTSVQATQSSFYSSVITPLNVIPLSTIDILGWMSCTKKCWEEFLYTVYEISYFMVTPFTKPTTSSILYISLLFTRFFVVFTGYYMSMKVTSNLSADSRMCSFSVD